MSLFFSSSERSVHCWCRCTKTALSVTKSTYMYVVSSSTNISSTLKQWLVTIRFEFDSTIVIKVKGINKIRSTFAKVVVKIKVTQFRLPTGHSATVPAVSAAFRVFSVTVILLMGFVPELNALIGCLISLNSNKLTTQIQKKSRTVTRTVAIWWRQHVGGRGEGRGEARDVLLMTTDCDARVFPAANDSAVGLH